MIYQGYHGKTEIYFKDLVAAEPKVEKVREAYRAKRFAQGVTQKQIEDLVLKLSIWCEQNFGQNRFNKDWFTLFGTDESAVPNAIKRWEEWVNAQPMSYRKVYYHPHVVQACIQSEEE